jgi:hypothetical protein
MSNDIKIRNSTVDFLVFTRDAGEDGIEVRVQDHDVWLKQKAIAQLFDIDRSVVTKHLNNIFQEGELDAFLRFNDAEVLEDKGKVTAAIAKEFAESEFEKYRVIQDSLDRSDL